MNEHAWIQFWKYVLIVGLGSYAVLALIIIPCGARDVYRLFQKLDRQETEDQSED